MQGDRRRILISHYEEPIDLGIPGGNEIYYTTVDGQPLSDNVITSLSNAYAPSSSLEGSGATLQSHTYENGKGIIRFNGGLYFFPGTTSRAYAPLRNNTQLENIVLPETITNIGQEAFFGCINLKRIKIPEGVTEIHSNLFRNCSSLVHIELSENITIIWDHAFQGCSSLVNIGLPDTVTTIDQYAFYGCSSLQHITIPDTIEYIGQGAFRDCASLRTIDMPSNISSIESYTFYGCSKLDNIEIPSTVNSIGEYAFMNCKSIEEITVPEQITSFERSVFENCEKLKSINIPFQLQNIDDYAFSGCSSLDSFSIPSYVTYIGEYAFNQCSSLSTPISIPSYITEIKPGTFKGCSSLNDIQLHDDITSIGAEAFMDCTSLTQIILPYNDTFNIISDRLFKGCSNLTSVSMSLYQPINSINDEAFCGCSNLTSIDIPYNVEKIGYRAFGFSGIINIDIPDNVTSLGTHLFYECSSLISVYLPNNEEITSIPYATFDRCRSLPNLVIPNYITSIEDFAFHYCEKLNIEIPVQITSIGYGAFSNCYSMKNIIIPDGVTEIKGETFFNCTSSEEIYIGPNITSIGNFAFANCPGRLILQNNIISNNYTWETRPSNDGWLGRSKFEELVIEPINSNNLTIGNYIFAFCDTIKRVIINRSIDAIGQGAFEGCTSLETIPLAIAHSIGNFAFKNCYSLTSGNLSSAYYIGMCAFENCYSVPEFKLISNENWTDNCIGNYAFLGCKGKLIFDGADDHNTPWHKNWTYSSNPQNTDSWLSGSKFEEIEILPNIDTLGSYTFCNYTSLKKLTIGANLGYNAGIAYTIGNGAFEGCSNLTELSINDTVTHIGTHVFKNCSSLYTTYLGNCVQSIGSYAFENCPGYLHINSNNITSINYPSWANRPTTGSGWLSYAKFNSLIFGDSIETIGDFGFVTFGSITSIDFSNAVNLHTIGNEVFGGSNITSLNIPGNIKSIGRATFENCKSLKTVTLNEGVETLGDRLFRYCDNLTTEINIPNSITTIGTDAFAGCINLLGVKFSENSSLTAINPGCFIDCYKMTDIDMPESVQSVGDLAFRGCGALQNIIFSDNMRLSTVPWSSFSIYSNQINSSPYRNIYFGDYIHNLNGFAFEGDNIDTLYIPSQLIYIDYRAFAAANINSLWFDNNVSIMDGNLLGNIGTIYVPENCLYDFQINSGLSGRNIVGYSTDGSLSVSSDEYPYITKTELLDESGNTIYSRDNEFIVKHQSDNISIYVEPIQSHYPWRSKVIKGKDFITVPDALNNVGPKTISIQLADNNTTEERIGQIKFSSVGNQSYILNIKQQKHLQHSPNTDEIKVMSFNVWVNRTGELAWTNRKEACYEMIREHRPSIIGLQETMYSTSWTDLYNTLSQDGYDGFAIVRSDGSQSGNKEGTGILYDTNVLEMLDSGNFWLSNPSTAPVEGETGRDWFGADYRRVANWAILKHKASEKTICYINTHLDLVQAARVKEMELIMQKFEEYGASCDYWISTGDYNATENSTEMQIAIGENGLMNSARLVSPVTDSNRTYNGVSSTSGGIIDHILCSKSMNVVEYHTVNENYKNVPYLSDHYPIYAIIKL